MILDYHILDYLSFLSALLALIMNTFFMQTYILEPFLLFPTYHY